MSDDDINIAVTPYIGTVPVRALKKNINIVTKFTFDGIRHRSYGVATSIFFRFAWRSGPIG